MRRQRTGEGYALFAVAAVAYVFLVMGIIIGAALQGDIALLKSADHWIERYQTLIAAMIALGVGLWARRTGIVSAPQSASRRARCRERCARDSPRYADATRSG